MFSNPYSLKLTSALTLFSTGVSAAAPSHEFFGAYFPDWLLYGLLAILVSVVTRLIMIKFRIETVIPYQLFVCTAIGFTLVAIIWFIA